MDASGGNQSSRLKIGSYQRCQYSHGGLVTLKGIAERNQDDCPMAVGQYP